MNWIHIVEVVGIVAVALFMLWLFLKLKYGSRDTYSGICTIPGCGFRVQNLSSETVVRIMEEHVKLHSLLEREDNISRGDN